MIKKIESIKNIGSYKEFDGSRLETFKKFNLIFGENGSGKTILSKLLSLYSLHEDDNYRNELINELFKEDSQIILNIEGSLIDFKYKNKLPNYNIRVFNSNFVANHIYDGDELSFKQFKFSKGTKIQSSEIIQMMNEIDEYTSIIGDNKSGLINRRNTLSKVVQKIEKGIRNEFNSRVPRKNLTGMRNYEMFTDRSIEKIQFDINLKYKEWKILDDDVEIENDRVIVETLKKFRIDLNIDSLFNSLDYNISSSAKQDVVKRIEQSGKIIEGADSDKWFENGLKLLLDSKDNNSVCPLCNSSLGFNIEEIIDEYQAYFDESYKKNRMILEDFRNELSQIKSQIVVRNEHQLNSIIEKYLFLFENEKTNLIFDEFDGIVNRMITNIDYMIDIVDKKINNEQSNLESCKFIEEDLEKYNELVDKFNVIRLTLRNYFENRNVSEKILDELKLLYIELFGAALRENSTEKNILQSLEKIDKEIDKLQRSVISKTEHLENEQKRLKYESQKINEFLKKLNVHKFKIDENTLEVKYKSGEAKKNLKHSLSEGEKTTLAFAYFLSKSSFETNSNYEDTIFFIDDPISSLDEDRVFYTTHTIISEVSECKQLFISSHSIKFLRIFMTFIKNIKGKICTYEIKNYKTSNIFGNPTYLTNFNSSYYMKLQEMIDYMQGRLSHEAAVYRIPNDIRIVLETFLGFKFGYLNKHEKNDRTKSNKIGVSPGLSDIIQMLKSEDDSSEIHKHICLLRDCEGLTSSNFLEELNYIIVHLSNIFSHGNISTLDYENQPISEKELKSITKKALSIMQFLDSISYFAILETGVVKSY